MSFSSDNTELKLQALDEAISYPPYKEVKDAMTIEVEDFNYHIIQDKVKDNEEFTNLEGAKVNLILEMIELLGENKKRYNVGLHNYIGFYWRGLPILIVKINSNTIQQRMMYISVKVYKDDLSEKLTNKNISRILAGGIGGLLIIGGIFAGITLFRKTNT